MKTSTKDVDSFLWGEFTKTLSVSTEGK